MASAKRQRAQKVATTTSQRTSSRAGTRTGPETARGAAIATGLTTKKSGVSKVASGKKVSGKNGRRAAALDKDEDGEVGASTRGSRRSRRNLDVPAPASEQGQMDSVGRKTVGEGTARKDDRTRLDVGASEPLMPRGYGPVVLDEDEAEDVMRRVKITLQAQDAEKQRTSGLKYLGVGAPPKPLLELSKDDELMPSFRRSARGTEGTGFEKYFKHPYESGGLPHKKQGDRYGTARGGSADLAPLSAARALRSPSTGNAPSTAQMCEENQNEHEVSAKSGQSRGESPAAKRPRYDALAIHQMAMSSRGRRSTRASRKHIKYIESDGENSRNSSDYCLSDDGHSSENMSDADGGEIKEEPEAADASTLTWTDVFPSDIELDERCYRLVGTTIPFRSVGLPTRNMRSDGTNVTGSAVPPCLIAPLDRIRYRNWSNSALSESTQSLVEMDGHGGMGDDEFGRTLESADQSNPEFKRRLTRELNSGNGAAMDQLATALCQVIKPTPLAPTPESQPVSPPETKCLPSPWTLEAKDTYTWYSGYDVVHGMSFVHPLVLRSFTPVHPLYYGDSPRVKWQGPLGKLPRMDPSKDYLSACIQYARACAVQAGNLPSPPLETQKLVARQFQHYEHMLDRIREVRLERQLGGGPMHKNVRAKPMLGNQSLLFTPLLFSPRHILVGQDPDELCERERLAPKRNFSRCSPSTQDIIEPPVHEERPPRQALVSLYDKGLIPQPMYRDKRPLKIGDLPPPYPTFNRQEAHRARKVVYRTRVVDSTTTPKPDVLHPSLSGTTNVGGPGDEQRQPALEPPRAAPPMTTRELSEIEKRKERDLRAYERRMRIRAEMGEEAWAAEQRRREENQIRKKIQYQTTKKCKDAVEWAQDAAKFPTSQTFNQHMVIERVKRAIQVIRETHLKKQQNLHDRKVVHFEKDGGVFVRLWNPEDEEEVARLVAERKKVEQEEIAAAIETLRARKKRKTEESTKKDTDETPMDNGTATATTNGGVSSQTSGPRSSANSDDESSSSQRSESSDDV